MTVMREPVSTGTCGCTSIDLCDQHSVHHQLAKREQRIAGAWLCLSRLGMWMRLEAAAQVAYTRYCDQGMEITYWRALLFPAAIKNKHLKVVWP